MVIPFGQTAEWIAAYADAVCAGMNRHEAGQAANQNCRICGKDFARCAISTGTLTVPVEGGGNILKRPGANPILSEHGKWRREHLGAWNATYGRSPYFVHLMPQIEEVYAHSEGLRLDEFNTRLLEVALGWIEIGAVPAQLPAGVREETAVKINRELSIFDALFRLGRETVLGLRTPAKR